MQHLLISCPDKNNGKGRTASHLDREARAMLSLSNVFTPLSTPDADTLIIIGPPPQAPNQSKTDYQYIEQIMSTPYRMNSITLKNLGPTGGPSAFEALLGPKSERTRRRFGREGLLAGVNTKGINYYVDLRPAEEGDEAVVLITNLTCTHGILNWYKAMSKYSIPPTTICGRDDFMSPLDQFRDTELTKKDDIDETEPPITPEAEYSALRHRSAIQRVLQAIGRNDPKLDSAPKMWTYFQVAKHLGVAKHERVAGWIFKWLYSHPNSNFIQSNPEVTYRIGMGIESTNMIRDAYSMLAGEKALHVTRDPTLRVSTEKSVHGRPLEKSVHGRPLEIMDEDECNRVDHAAASLRARIKFKFEHLIDENMEWLKQSKEYCKLVTLEAKDVMDTEIISTTEKLIKDYVRGRILWVLGRNYLSDHVVFDQALPSCRDFREDLPAYFSEVYGQLSEEQRLLTRTFWIALQTEKIEEGDCNIYTPIKASVGGALHDQTRNSRFRQISDDMIAREDDKPGTGRMILTRKDLCTEIENLNVIVGRKLFDDQESNHFTARAKSPDPVLYPRRTRFSETLDQQVEGSTAQGKHNLTESDEEADPPLEMIAHVRTHSDSEKRRRLAAGDASTSLIHLQTSTLPLRSRDPVMGDYAVAASTLEENNDTYSKDRQSSLAQGQTNVSPTEVVPSSSPRPNSIFQSGKVSRNAQRAAFDSQARLLAEARGSMSWTGFDGDIYVRAEPSYFIKQNTESSDTDHIWVAAPSPFNLWETTIIPCSDEGTAGKKKTWPWSGRKPQPTEQAYAANNEKQYWRAATCQLFCKLPDNSINLVREDSNPVPTLLEASSRIPDDVHLRNYILAYDTYAQKLAETLDIPYWTSLASDMYLHSPPKHMSADTNTWNIASSIFDHPDNIEIRYEGEIKVEYWRSPAGHYFRRRNGRIELYTQGKDEAPPPKAATINAAPLKVVTNYGPHEIAPTVRSFRTPFFNVKGSSRSERPVRKPVSRSPDLSKTTPAMDAMFSWSQYINPIQMLMQFSDILSKLCEEILNPPHIYHGADPIPRDLMDTLMCLTDDEWKYLPLWAEGCDDGTGGVFDEVDVPNLDAGGFAGGKRGLGSDNVDGKGESDGWSEVGSEAISTVGKASKLATDGTETVKSFDSFFDDEINREIRDMKIARESSAVRGEEEEDQVTVRDAMSDIQGEYFGDIDNDDGTGDVQMGHEDSDDDFEHV